jgi:hypothetical protein
VQWISPLKPHKRHHDIKAKRLKGTGSWFLETPEFERWCNGDSTVGGFSPLFACYGISGAGKSVMK